MAQAMLETKELLSNESIGHIFEGIFSRYARFICTINLQGILELLRKCWAFFLAIDMATYMAIGYCNIRIRICFKSAVHDIYLLPIPVHDRHTGDTIFNKFTKAMEVIYSDWYETISEASSDVEKKMKGRHQGVITRLKRVAKLGLIRVWCGAHQLDLCMQSLYLALLDEFYSKRTLIVSYLRRQQNFILGERSQ